MFGVNLSGAEFGSGVGRYGYDYTYPQAVDLDYYQSKGVELIRLPFKWERMQTTPGGALNTAELGHMKEFLTAAEAHGMKVIIDLHNYGRFGDKLLGSAGLPNAVFADFWGKLAQELKGFGAVAGYDLMNEPHDLTGGSATWNAAAQAAVDAIRKVDMAHDIYVEGYGWATASQWAKNNAGLKIADPADKIVYQAHLYFDANNSGTYKGSYDAEGANALTGVQRLQPFFDWLKANNARGFVGEFNVPDNDPRWLTVLDNAMQAMQANGVSGTLWGGGSTWRDDYMMNLRDGMADSAQMQVLNHYVTAPRDAAIVGTNKDDKIAGTDGMDRLLGHKGSDILYGSAGSDKLDGGAGTDTADYTASSGAINVDMLRALQTGGHADGDTFIGIENVTGGAYADVIAGTDLANVLSGGGGNDRLDGRLGEDTLYGGGDDDRLIGGQGKDKLFGGDGNDILDGGAASDILTGGAGADTFLFAYQSDSAPTTPDRIADLSAGDIIDLSRIDANSRLAGDQGFTLVSAMTKSPGQMTLTYDAVNAQTGLRLDMNGDGLTDMFIILGGDQRAFKDFIF